jgi:hypothetical protein
MLRSREPADGGAVPAAQREVRAGSGFRRALRTACLRPSDPRKRGPSYRLERTLLLRSPHLDKGWFQAKYSSQRNGKLLIVIYSRAV